MWTFLHTVFSVVDLAFEDDIPNTVTLQIKFIALDIRMYITRVLSGEEFERRFWKNSRGWWTNVRMFLRLNKQQKRKHSMIFLQAFI
jgi:hypothetical protein